ncbi:hypothetical protein AMEX_G4116 [Astyanax mexicanus]|uniref:Uncharacterized protein n=1 Tax=Astyanax mexicanus TaxID=7994 RepID=A0A8T2MB87_ASTMX|nr:hypothetical protein AMEX_G4116 [Astyanax mexicanus]
MAASPLEPPSQLRLVPAGQKPTETSARTVPAAPARGGVLSVAGTDGGHDGKSESMTMKQGPHVNPVIPP